MHKIIGVIKELEKNRQTMFISKDSIELISILLRKLKPEKVLEIGMFYGYSTLWFSLYAKQVITLEIDETSIKIAKENFKKANCRNISIIPGDAILSLKKLKDKVDIVFIDAKKSDYKTYLELSLNVINEAALIFVDNTISHKESMKDFFEYLQQSDLFFKELNIGKGLMIISKKLTEFNF
mgnify:CR=1 FL=1